MKYMDVALRGSVSSTVIAIISLLPAPALAQQSSTAGAMPQTEVAAAQPASATPQTTAGQPQKVEGAQPSDASAIVVTGFRASLTAAVNLKRRSNQIIDAITAEDIAKFPDANLAESIQRLPGVSIDRDNGEGRSVTIRGLSGDFQLTRLNGIDAQSVAGGNSSDAGGNRTRGFDFNTFASELFGAVTVTKTTSAADDEGSLGAIIDLTTGRPLSYKHDRLALGVEGEYRENGHKVGPRLTGLFSKRLSDRFGVLGSISYQKQRQTIDSYSRSIGAFEYTYRNSQLNGITPPTFGFALPSTAGTGPLYGSDPAAYAKIKPTTIIPALPSISRRELNYKRLGATLTAQWKPTDSTEIIVDGVMSKYNQSSENDGITTIGLNRNGTNTRATQGTLRSPTSSSGIADRVALYPNCVPSATTDCGTQIYGGTVLPGMVNSMNPNNLNPYDYYNSPSSPGFVATSNKTGFYSELIGRPATKIMDADVNAAGQADYLRLDDVDWRSSADAQYGRTKFKQLSLNGRQDFTDRFRAEGTLGWSKSAFNFTGLLAEFNAINQDNYVFDDRGGGKMPVFNPGFDVANPNNWSLVKGLSTIRFFQGYIDNRFKVGRLNFTWDIIPQNLAFRFGATRKQYQFKSDQARRNQDIEAINPTLLEAHLNSTDLGKTVGFGQGLDVSSGTPTSFFAPDLGKFIQEFGIDCNCVNKWGDFRAVVDGRQRNAVTEDDLSGFGQLDYNFDLFGNPLRGNLGLRVARTRETGVGSIGATDGALGLPVTAHNKYTDWLPALNAVYEPTRGLLVRFAASKTIARPMLQNLTPGTTSFSSGLSSSGAAPTATVGNPYLKPFRSTNFDVSVERYFGRGGLFAVAAFSKHISTFPQQIALEAPLSDVFEPAIYQQILQNMTSSTLRAYTEAGGPWAVRQFRDAPGGNIRGVEIDAQTNFTFLPHPFDDMGITANYTHIWSKLNYLTNTVLAVTQKGSNPQVSNAYATAPWLNTSPDSFNATLFYENKIWSARVSAAYRTRYVNRFPLVSGTCDAGLTTNNGGPCNSPVIADFRYRENQLNVDAALAYNITRYAEIRLEGRNLTNAPDYETMYAASPVTQTYASTGRVITAGLRLVF